MVPILGCTEYLFIIITPKSTLSRSSRTNWGPNYGLNRSVWKSFVLDRKLWNHIEHSGYKLNQRKILLKMLNATTSRTNLIAKREMVQNFTCLSLLKISQVFRSHNFQTDFFLLFLLSFIPFHLKLFPVIYLWWLIQISLRVNNTNFFFKLGNFEMCSALGMSNLLASR